MFNEQLVSNEIFTLLYNLGIDGLNDLFTNKFYSIFKYGAA